MDRTENLSEAIREIQKTAVAAAELKVLTLNVTDGAGGVEAVPVLVTHDGGQSKVMPLLDVVKSGTEWAEARRLHNAKGPDRREGTANHQTLASFMEHANRFKSEHSAMWADADARRLVVVLDYHPAGADSAPLWRRHRGIYPCPLSEAWRAWGGETGLKLSQDDFAALLDSRDRELASGALPGGKPTPDPAALISLANNLEVYSTATAKRERDPNTGRLKVSFTEDKGVSGTVAPPPAFLVSIPIFRDGEPRLLEVRLQVSVEEGKARFHVRLQAASEVLRTAFEEICTHVEAVTALPRFTGTPE